MRIKFLLRPIKTSIPAAARVITHPGRCPPAVRLSIKQSLKEHQMQPEKASNISRLMPFCPPGDMPLTISVL